MAKMNDQVSQPTESVRAPEEAAQADATGDSPSSTNSSSASGDDRREPGRELIVLEQPSDSESWFSRFLIRLGLRSGSTLRDDLHEALAGEGEASDVFTPEERAMLQNILRLRELRVDDVMVARAEIHAVDFDTPLGEVLQLFEETGHSRLPVYDDTLDDPRGMVLIKDLLLHITKISGKGSRAKSKGRKVLDLSKVDLSIPLKRLKVIRKVLFVPPSMLASHLMARMQATRTQMALVIDEYGGTDGLVSLEDIVEEVVGEIEDEHDDDEADEGIVETGIGVWEVDARTELDRLTETIGNGFDPGEVAEDMDTLGGLVFALAGHIPVRGEVVTGIPGYEFRVLEADPRRIRRVQVVQISQREKRRKATAVKAANAA
ncbi:MAG: hemolysin family protein [Ahrensia sp.]|nr:hemolysin family protein [Ahrensia sp.]